MTFKILSAVELSDFSLPIFRTEVMINLHAELNYVSTHTA